MRHGRQRPGAADVDLDLLQLRGDLLRRELVGGRPAWRAGHEAERCLVRERVDLDDDPIGLVVEIAARIGPLVDVGDHVLDPLDAPNVRIDREPETAKQVE